MASAVKDNIVSELSETDINIISIGRSIFDPIWAEKEHLNKSSELIHIRP